MLDSPDRWSIVNIVNDGTIWEILIFCTDTCTLQILNLTLDNNIDVPTHMLAVMHIHELTKE